MATIKEPLRYTSPYVLGYNNELHMPIYLLLHMYVPIV